LTPKEFDILVCLAEQPGVVVTRRELLEEVWDPHWYGSPTCLRPHQGHGGEGLTLTIWATSATKRATTQTTFTESSLFLCRSLAEPRIEGRCCAADLMVPSEE
jgi:hypothetical protein